MEARETYRRETAYPHYGFLQGDRSGGAGVITRHPKIKPQEGLIRQRVSKDEQTAGIQHGDQTHAGGQLHSAYGNQALQRLRKGGIVMPKLRIGQPNDVYEQEADRIAEQVMRMPEPGIQRKPG